MSDLSSALADFFDSAWPADAATHEPGDLAETPWAEFADLGLHLVGIPEEAGGSGGSFADLVAIAILTGRHAADIPAIESATAAWALSQAGVPVESASSYSLALTPSPVDFGANGNVTGTVRDVPWGSSVDQVVVLGEDGQIALLNTAEATLRRGRDLAGQPRDTLTFDSVTPVAVGSGVRADALYRRGAVLRIAQLAGALQATAELTREYAGARVQFGKPIGAFQAVQAHIVQLQQMAVMTTALADRLSMHEELPELDVSAAQVVAAENALTAAAAAHQAHGAIGMTREYRLHLLTRRLHTWSGDFGEAQDQAAHLGALASQAPSFTHLILDNQKHEATP